MHKRCIEDLQVCFNIVNKTPCIDILESDIPPLPLLNLFVFFFILCKFILILCVFCSDANFKGGGGVSEAPPKNLIITNARFSNIDLRFHMLHTPIYEYNCVI